MSTPKSSPRKPPLSTSPLRSVRPTFACVSGSGYDEAPPPPASVSTSARDNDEEEVDELASDEDEPQPRDRGEGRSVKCKWADCGLTLPDQPTLVAHLQEEHFQPGKDSYSCQWEGCGRKGARQATRHSLVTHVRAHTGERPYTCPQPGCGSTFTRSDAMSKHLRTLHNLPLEETNGRGVRKAKPGKGGAVDMEGSGQYPPAPLSTLGEGASEVALSEIGDGEPGDGTYKPGGKKGKGAKPKGKAGGSAVGGSRGGAKGRGRGKGGGAGSPGGTLSRAEQELLEDEDMAEVLHRVRFRQPFWTVTPDDKKAMEFVRAHNPRKPVTDLNEDDEDSFDEGITGRANNGVVAVLQDERGEEVDVLGRSKWQTRYIMAKVKLMLVEEENDMRKDVLEKLMAHEAKLKEEIEKESYEWGV